MTTAKISRRDDRVPVSGARPDELDELMARVADGDAGAFADVYDAISPVVFGLVCSIVRDSDQAQEVTQEVFIHVWRSAARFDPTRGSARAWILAVAHRRSLERVCPLRANREHRATQVNGRDVSDVAETAQTRLDAMQFPTVSTS